ncbi:DNA-directed DNA polymerase [Tanacetum coccineum]
MNTTSRESVSKTDERIDKLADQLSTLVEIVSKKVVTPAPVKAVEEICVTCSGPHAFAPSIRNLPYEKLSLPELTPTRKTLELADRSITHPKGLAEDVYVKMGKFHFPTDFVVEDFEADPRVPLILRRSFLRTGRALIDVYGEEITLRVDNEAVTFNLDQTTRYFSTNDKSVNRIDIIDEVYEIEAYLKDDSISLEIHADCLKDDEKEALLKVLKSHKRAIAWKITDIKGIDPRFCTHKFLMEDDYKPSPWVSLVHCVPKKGGITVVANEENELILTRLVTGWRVCIDYRKLNEATRKDHFPLPFMDQMLERLAGNEFYCFLDGFLRDSFDSCLSNLEKMLKRCEDTKHKISKSKSGIEVDRAKVDVIAKLPHPTTVKGVRSFLGHAGFYRRFIQDFSKIARPMTHLLEKETPFVFSKDCIDAFETLK